MSLEPTLQGLLQSKLQWIFVGGKGGVGKTTTSCAVATLFASTPIYDEATNTTRPRRVLLISTDPAHNLSDAFSQKFANTPTPVKGMEETLFAMEVDPTNLIHTGFGAMHSAAVDASTGTNAPSPFVVLGSILKEAAGTLPGIDELSVFAEILRGVQQLSYDIVIFDTAPTGHTLRLLALPHTVNSTIEKLLSLEGLESLIRAASTLLSASTSLGDVSSLMPAVNKWRESVQEVQRQFTDAEKTAFVCVCIPEFLSVYETERLVQELMKYDISCDSIVVNQLVLKPSSEPACRMCMSRQKIQAKYLAQIDALYEDFHVVRMPLLSDEVRGIPALQRFARFLVEPYDADRHGYIDVCGDAP
ncbi:anion-transporting ATPase [Trypanosoma rangeli]|uniref:ATPase ASNA1 homolog n=1 Tax=Trypanosoma rangeli TaxID=5698 RepID=A0A422NQC3_TRYRA|nr:anion-transporting ATPase [Trypanosoma rangeli]RNF07697.1 anion-transporting ATPase [Trypanosoma rangeli]|eukprot:RNF07697.1 anion-transporting ATPase [Trypanosoma rangeli]